jgi:hypothetical protein
MTKTSSLRAVTKPQPDDAQAAVEVLVAAARPDAPAKADTTTSEPRQTKIQEVVALLRRREGACIADIMTATGWQAHSVRGAMSGAVKKGLGLTIESKKVGGIRVYRVIDAATA